MANKSGTQILAEKLLAKIYTTATLKIVSDTLEDLSQNRTFKTHANSIVNDPTLTDAQKGTQLSYVLRTIEFPLLYDFFAREIAEGQIWIFNTDKIDYLDRFVQTFQLSTEQTEIVYLTTAIKLTGANLKQIADDLSESFAAKVILNHEVNPAILGGIQMRVQNLVFDYSLKSKFSQFQTQWLGSLEKTSAAVGRDDPDALY